MNTNQGIHDAVQDVSMLGRWEMSGDVFATLQL